jgi:hypothetical protein
MNIFALHPSYSPAACAALHCNQHLHKMILESAQMVSSACSIRGIDTFLPSNLLYKPAYPKHPCTLWTAESLSNIAWLCELGLALDDIRFSLSNCDPHASSVILKEVLFFLKNDFFISSIDHTPHVFCGPATISARPLKYPTIWQMYQAFYRRKATEWAARGTPMTYKGREIPVFLEDILSPSAPPSV